MRKEITLTGSTDYETDVVPYLEGLKDGGQISKYEIEQVDTSETIKLTLVLLGEDINEEIIRNKLHGYGFDNYG